MWARSKRGLFFPFLIAKLCARVGVVVVEDEERCKIKPVIDLSLIKRLKDNMAHKKSHTFATKSVQSLTEATPTVETGVS